MPFLPVSIGQPIDVGTGQVVFSTNKCVSVFKQIHCLVYQIFIVTLQIACTLQNSHKLYSEIQKAETDPAVQTLETMNIWLVPWKMY